MNVGSYLITRPKIFHPDPVLIFAGGFLATLAMTTIMYVQPLIGLGQVDLPTWTARLFVADPVQVAVLGIALHLCLGFGYAWLFADQIEPRLAVGPGVAGLLFGAILWLFAQAVAVPVLGFIAPAASHVAAASPGFFSLHLGLGAAFASLIAHLAYGGTLGVVYGCHCGGQCR